MPCSPTASPGPDIPGVAQLNPSDELGKDKGSDQEEYAAVNHDQNQLPDDCDTLPPLGPMYHTIDGDTTSPLILSPLISLDQLCDTIEGDSPGPDIDRIISDDDRSKRKASE